MYRIVLWLLLTSAPMAIAPSNPISVASAAEIDCSTVDLQAPKKSPLRRMPIHDQDSTGTCYAQVGADLLNFKLLKKNSGLRLRNPLHMAFLSRLDERGELRQESSDTWGGSIKESINQSLGLGACSEESSKSKFDELRGVFGRELSDAEIVGRLEHYLKENSPSALLRNRSFTDLDACTQEKDKKSLDAYLDSKKLGKRLALDILKQLFKDCAKREKKIKDLGSAEIYGDFTNEEASTALSALLREGGPVGLAISSGVLNNPRERCLEFDPVSQERRMICTTVENDPHAMHAVTLIGQMEINGKCHYLIRNSWGAKWQAKQESGKPQPCACNYAQGSGTSKTVYQSMCTEAPTPQSDGAELTFTEEDLNAGFAESYTGCWVPREAILGNLSSFTVLR